MVQSIDSSTVSILSYEDVVDALGFEPVAATELGNTLTASDISTALGYSPYNAATNSSNFLVAGDLVKINGQSLIGHGNNMVIKYDDSSL